MGRAGRASRCRTGPGIAAADPEPVRSAGLRRSRRRRRATAGRPRSPRAGASGWGSAWSRGSASSTRRSSTRSWRAGRTGRWPRWSSGPGSPRRSWSGSSGPGRWIRSGGRGASSCGSCARWPARHAVGWTGARCAAWAGRPASVRRRPGGRWTCAFPRPRPRRCRHHRIGADRRFLRGHRARCTAPGRDALPAGARAARGGDQRGALGDAVRAGSGSAGWSSPASTR